MYYEDLYPLISFLPRYANGQPHESDRLPLWHAQSQDHDEQEAWNAELHEPVNHARGETLVESNGRSSRSSSRLEVKKHKDDFDPEAALADVESDVRLRPASDPPKTTVYDFIPLLRFFRWIFHVLLKRTRPGEARHRKYKAHVESNIPLEISLCLARCVRLIRYDD